MKKIKRNKDLIAKKVNDTFVVFDLEKSRAYHLNETAEYIWKSLRSPKNIRQLAEVLSKHFSISLKVAINDVATLVTKNKRMFIEQDI